MEEKDGRKEGKQSNCRERTFFFLKRHLAHLIIMGFSENILKIVVTASDRSINFRFLHLHVSDQISILIKKN